MDRYQPYEVAERGASWATTAARVYGWMFIGLIVSAVMAFITISTPLVTIAYNPASVIVLLFAELALVWTLSSRAIKMQYASAAGAFIVYSALNGITLSSIFFMYTLGSIAYVFMISAAIFGFMSVYGLVTKTDLTSVGNLLFMGLIGIILASLVNLFIHSSALYMLISYIGVAVFIGLTAYDSQKIKRIHASYAGTGVEKNVAIVGALSLYLDFINLFLFILRILGRSRD